MLTSTILAFLAPVGFQPAEIKPPVKVDTPVLQPHQKVLLDAAELVRKHGTVKGTWHRPGKGYCILGAINMAATGDPYAEHHSPGDAKVIYTARIAAQKAAGGSSPLMFVNDHSILSGFLHKWKIMKILRAAAAL